MRIGNKLRLALGTFLVLVVVYLTLPPSFIKFLTGSFDLTEVNSYNANVLGREALTLRMIEIFLSHPLLGVGPGIIQKSIFSLNESRYLGLGGLENQYATILAENGALGIFFFGGFVYVAFRVLLSNNFNEKLTPQGRLREWVAVIFADLLVVSLSCSVTTAVPMFYMMALIGTSAGGTAKAHVVMQRAK